MINPLINHNRLCAHTIFTSSYVNEKQTSDADLERKFVKTCSPKADQEQRFLMPKEQAAQSRIFHSIFTSIFHRQAREAFKKRKQQYVDVKTKISSAQIVNTNIGDFFFPFGEIQW